jgi:hypothetical protein
MRRIRPTQEDAAHASKARRPLKRVFRTGTDRLVDRKDVERILKISRSTIIRYEKEGWLKPVKLNELRGGRVRYSFSAIVRFRDGK